MAMDIRIDALRAFLESVHPFDSLPQDELARVAGFFSRREYPAGTEIYSAGEPLKGIFLIKRGAVEVIDRNGELVSILGPRSSFGERGILRDGLAVTSARASEDSVVLMLPDAELRRLIALSPAFARFFSRARPADSRGADLSTLKVADLMARNPVTCRPDATVQEAARLMREKHISSLAVTENGSLVGILTTRDLASRVLAEGLGGDTRVAQVMTADPLTLTPDALGSDILHTMLERRIGHLPVVENGEIRGVITQTDLTRFQAVSTAQLVRDAAMADSPAEMAQVTARIPKLLTQLVAANNAHEVVTRLITDVADTVTRRLLKLAEAEFGPAPVPWLWLACGSQGRQEQTGFSDQDNCLILDDAATEDDLTYFRQVAKYVSDGLNTAGYAYCPGDMMATNPRWCQPRRVWRRYFRGWIDQPSPEAQMLASVMFDLRPIGGQPALFRDLQTETLEAASKNSIFVAHMVFELAQAPAAAEPPARLRHHPLGRASQPCRHEARRRRAGGRSRARLRADGPPHPGQHPRPPAGGRGGRRDLRLGRPRPDRGLRPHRPAAAGKPGRAGARGPQARQLPRALGSERFRTQPPARRLRRGPHDAVGGQSSQRRTGLGERA